MNEIIPQLIATVLALAAAWQVGGGLMNQAEQVGQAECRVVKNSGFGDVLAKNGFYRCKN